MTSVNSGFWLYYGSFLEVLFPRRRLAEATGFLGFGFSLSVVSSRFSAGETTPCGRDTDGGSMPVHVTPSSSMGLRMELGRSIERALGQ